MMNIYVATSWRNESQQRIVALLRGVGHEVYDFQNPAPGVGGFSWGDIDPGWKGWSTEEFRAGLCHPLARDGFARDISAISLCDALVLVRPCGSSSHLEAVLAKGIGKPVVVRSGGSEPELMYAMFDAICADDGELLVALDVISKRRTNPLDGHIPGYSRLRA